MSEPSDIIPATGTTRKRVIRMGSRYQNGTIQTRGNWVYLLYRVDTPEGRKQVTHRLCPGNGVGAMSVAKQRRKAQEVISEAGVNVQTRILQATLGTTFKQHAEWFIKHVQQRKRNPVATSTVTTWLSCIDKQLNPQIGELPLAQINNAVAKNLIAYLVRKACRINRSRITSSWSRWSSLAP
jgi:hypothetical protein